MSTYPRVPPFARVQGETAQETGRRAFAYALDHGTAELSDLEIEQAIGASIPFVIQADLHPPVRERYSVIRAHLMRETARRIDAARLEEMRAAVAAALAQPTDDQDNGGGQEVSTPAPRPAPPSGPGLAIQPPQVQRPRAALPFTL